MKSLLSTPLSSARLWEFSFFLIGCYLVFNPVLAYPASMAVALGGGLVLLFFQPLPPETMRILGKPWMLFLLYLLATSLWSVSPGITLQSSGFVFLGTLLYSMAKMRDGEAQSRIEGVGFALACLASLMAVYQWFFGFEKLSLLLPQLTGGEQEILQAAIHNKRASGPFVTQGALAAFLILFIPLGFIAMKTASGFKKKLFGFSTLVMLLGLLATQSVGAFLCLTLAVLLILLKRRFKGAVFGVIAAGVLTIMGLIFARGIHSWLVAALGTRIDLWKAALVLFGAHPWLGSGLGTFDQIYQDAGLPLITGARFTHNLPLQFLVETGIAGFVLFLFFLVDIGRRFKLPSRWEGWGVMTGVLAFLLFSLLDLPFQMPEIIWFFAVIAARLELRPGKEWKLPEIPIRCLEIGLLAVLLVSGFWPPFRPWNFALLACSLWVLAGHLQPKFDKVPLWIFAGALFLAVRAFVSPSAIGAVWFLELSGILLVFYLILPFLANSHKFIKIFAMLGLVWALKIWWESIHYSSPGINNWIHFQYSDVKDWIIFPNPKQIGLVLIPLVFIFWKKPSSGAAMLALLFSFLTMLRLKSFGALLGLSAGFFVSLKRNSRIWAGIIVLAGVLAFIYLRSLDPSPTKWARLEIWGSAIKVWEKSPFLGVGPGVFAGLYHQVKAPRLSGASQFLMDAQYTHNEFLELLTAFGLVGFLFGFFLFLKAWRSVRDTSHRSALAGLSAASLVDFCLHTPLIALQGVGLLRGNELQRTKQSMIGGFLVLGLTLGLFSPPVFSNLLKTQVESHLSQNRISPVDLRSLETAERLNAWDARMTASKADYLEKLFMMTKDPVWARKSDEAFERILMMEEADGQWRLKKAERLTARLRVDHSSEAHQQAALAWDGIEFLLPWNAFVSYEKGLFMLGEGNRENAIRQFDTAVAKEPNFAAAWVYLGLSVRGFDFKNMQGYRPKPIHEYFQKALDINDKWKSADRIDPLEKQLATLSPEMVEFLKKELARGK